MSTSAKTPRDPRDIVVKTLLNADEYLQFDEVCVASDVSHSAALREMVKGLVDRFRNGKATPARKEWPNPGQNLAMFATARQVAFGAPQFHRRL